MNSYLINQANSLVQDALAALKSGDNPTARRMAEDAIILAPELEQPWLILAALSSPEESLAHIHKALEINPDSQPAQKALDWANTRLQIKPLNVETDEQASEQANEGPVTTYEPLQDDLLFEPQESSPIQVEPSFSLQGSPGLNSQTKKDLTPTSSPRGDKFRKFSGSPAGILLWTMLGLLAIVLVAELTFAWPKLNDLAARFFPGNGCPQSLVVGPQTFDFRTIKPLPDGSLEIPLSHPKQASWVEGTTNNTVFVLNPSADNLTLITEIGVDDTATVTWADCSTATYSLSLAIPGDMVIPTLLDQSRTGLTLLLPSGSGLSGFVIRGDLLP
ncbi:MAG: hypothetical protein A2X25_07880 [Chloroflexi bacterium GWB2_49_20]|nr:MAG: hypothetical protein A2X25_07880 [Chloroflexi bacterium GWB2_49_20]OGN78071.1 MAG: hypothetical protein A2X26_15685 [Chloroflexi bacterium GWC2_49_37]OGN85109.1 MAG: hypothetical protein A2X27_10385 [Chloroflexi bacterium GWD2_49_16]HBG74851.1 hypothetical protein [Anaerolineae bacterium]HCC78423.1 hypothetical protein [Anaerolineae bacterium]